MNPHDLVHRYFELAVDPDLEHYYAQLAPDVVVEDEGRLRHGLDEVRAWRTEVPPVTYTVRSIVDADDRHVAVAEIAGDFPGSPVDLTFTFGFEGDLISALTIRP